MTTFLMISLLTSLASPEQIRVEDPYLVCTDNHMPNSTTGLPAGYSPTTYYSVMQLCSHLNGASANVGCLCTSARHNAFACHREIAEPALWNAIYTAGQRPKPFPEFCKDMCYCTSRREASRQRALTDLAYHYQDADPLIEHVPDDPDSAYTIVSRPLHNSSVRGSQGFSSGAVASSEAWSPEDTLGKEPVPPVEQGQCGNSCTSNANCSASGATACVCSTQSEQYQPGSGTTAFVAACILSMSVGGKRGETRPCPCNATYVSHACCGVADGRVWEREEFKLGELLSGHEL